MRLVQEGRRISAEKRAGHTPGLPLVLRTFGGLAALVTLAVSHLDLRIEPGFPGFRPGLHQPIAGPRGQRTANEQRVIMSLHRDELIAGEVL